ncbi:hypothetical protein PYCCODRAFT_1357909 [Trametes coccinea BRFM310]|uniref:RRM domain-containing protein n=1 Tax=Trametes coccinea (strain BRFM310) TaxID=1353009 RepID=A0A1Y2J447_TRAC3|nr:hypothetical protein PYCCODRAFT_1357909 [Trametes coccinea BRFM310]
MSSTPALAQLSSDRSPSFSSAFSRSSTRETPSTPPGASGCSLHVPPTPPDSSSRTAANLASSPRSDTSPNTSSVAHSLSSTLSAAAPQFQSRLLDTPIDIHVLSPELDSPATSVASAGTEAVRDASAAYKIREQGSPTPTQDATSRKGLPEQLPPPFIPAGNRSRRDEEVVVPATAPPEPPQDSEPKPPNVYINGLPPNFPEEDLLAMCSPFGNVLSVRTFTRHVSDKPSGYGFVLFERLAAAEKCIEALRKYRNLHPSFSKQVHKIPGTAYASAPSASNTGPADSFKSKMEQLRDTASTNLYMEGLPLSVSEQELRVLVTPYRIMSSRFFHTRLSHPPRIIAFVRLESREAAEDIIERLHGRLVRGRNDAGCRISVRFADTPEQRELRRTERTTREDEQSPARLTMARAALLNLKGTQYQSDARSPTLGAFETAGLASPISPELGFVLNALGSGSVEGQLSPVGHASPLQSPGAFVSGLLDPQSLSPFVSDASGFESLNAQGAHVSAQDLRLAQQLLPESGAGQLDEQTQLRLALLSMQGPRANAQQGYTPVERLILQAHVRQRANTLGANLDTLQERVSDVNNAASIQAGLTSTGQAANRRLLNCLPAMSEDDFHASAALLQNQSAVAPTFARQPDFGAYGRSRGDNFSVNVGVQPSAPGQQLRQRNHTLAAQLPVDPGAQSLHLRSSTLPSPNASIRKYSHGLSSANMPLYDSANSVSTSMPTTSGYTSRPHGTNNAPRISTNQQHIPPSLNSNGIASQRANSTNLRVNAQPNTHTLFTSKSNINLPSVNARSKGRSIPADTSTLPTLPPSTAAAHPNSGASAGQTSAPASGHPQDGDADAEESPVVSPALTYSARTPASLSPATPYSGFFSDGGSSFKSTIVGSSGENMDSLRFAKESREDLEPAARGVNQQQ